MGCLVEVGGATDGEAETIERIFQARERQFSRFRDDSELSRVNRTPREIVTVSKTFGQMVERALTAASVTRGLVDPTLAGALSAAGYDRDFDELEPRADAARAGALGRWRAVRMVGRLLMRPVGLELDLNGVVKGRTVDEAVDLLSGDGFVAAGGDYAGHGEFDVALPGGARFGSRTAALRRAGRRSGAGCARASGSTI
jgi:thiamine biosynthesis lipoprotein ApbE